MSGVQFNSASCGLRQCQTSGGHKVKPQGTNSQGVGIPPTPNGQPAQQNYNIKPGGLSLIG